MLLIRAHVDQFLYPGHYPLKYSGMFWKLVLLLLSDKRVELDFIVLLTDGKDM